MTLLADADDAAQDQGQDQDQDQGSQDSDKQDTGGDQDSLLAGADDTKDADKSKGDDGDQDRGDDGDTGEVELKIAWPEDAKPDPETEKGIIEMAQGQKLTQEQLQGVVNWWQDLGKQRYEKFQEDIKAYRTRSREELQKEWGPDFETKLGQAKKAVKEFGGDALMNVLTKSGLADNPDIIRAFSKAGAMISEDGLIDGEQKPKGQLRTPGGKPMLRYDKNKQGKAA